MFSDDDGKEEGAVSLDRYLDEIDKIPLLTREQERELMKRFRKGDEKALHQLVRANLRYVVSLAKEYVNQGLSLADLVNEGNVGLIKAAHRFDETRGYKFISYAVWYIRQAMLQALAKRSRMIRFPLERAKVSRRIGKTDQEGGKKKKK